MSKYVIAGGALELDEILAEQFSRKRNFFNSASGDFEYGQLASAGESFKTAMRNSLLTTLSGCRANYTASTLFVSSFILRFVIA